MADEKGLRVAIAQTPMQWTTEGNRAATLPMHTAGVATFELGAGEFVSDALPDPAASA